MRTITLNAIVAAIYFLLTLINPFSFGFIQVRISEVLILLCFFNRDYAIGVTIGCILANLLPGSLGIFDVILGSLATLLSCLLVSTFKHLLLSTIVPVIINGVVIGLELFYLTDSSIPLLGLMGFVSCGEIIAVTIVGYLILFFIKKSPKFFEIIRANQNVEYKW